VAAILTVLCVVFLITMLVAEVRSSLRLRYFSKPLASLCFVALGALVADWHGATRAYSMCIVAGLILGAAGDVALMFKGQRSFLVGLVSFLFGHAAYVVACATLVAPSEWPSVMALAPAAAALVVLAYLWPHLGKMRAPVLCYMATIVLMVVGALAVFAGHDSQFSDGQALLLLVGALLFFVSDIAVAKSRFVKAQLRDRMWGLPAYYAGQLLIAWSLLT
jgi:uncharacterized membrane protein YhhN